MEANNQLKLFIWHSAMTEYADCVMFALAHNVEEARKAVTEAKASDDAVRVIKWDLEPPGQPEIIEDVKGFFLWGGGKIWR